MRFRGVKNMLTCDWQQSSIAPDLEDNKISAVLCISKNKKPPITMDIYTTLGIQHYSSTLEGLGEDAHERESIRIAKIINHFVSNNQRILIHHTSEECVVAYAMIFYMIWSYYHDHNGCKKENIKKPEVSIATQSIQDMKIHGIESDLLQSMVQKLYRLENKYAGTL
jgi:hypothetical protein